VSSLFKCNTKIVPCGKYELSNFKASQDTSVTTIVHQTDAALAF